MAQVTRDIIQLKKTETGDIFYPETHVDAVIGLNGNKDAKTVLAAPNGAAGKASFRQLQQDDIAPIMERTFTYKCSANDANNGQIYFLNIVPTSEHWATPWMVHYTLEISCDTSEDVNAKYCHGFYDVYAGFAGSTRFYHIFNDYYSITYYPAYYHQLLYHDTEAKYNSYHVSHPAKAGLRIQSSWGANTRTRTYIIKVYSTQNCEVSFIDPIETYGNIYNTTYYAKTDFNAIGQGLQELSDDSDITRIQLYYSRITAGINGLMGYGLCMQDGNGKWQSFTTTGGTGASKTKNSVGFRLGSPIYYLNQGPISASTNPVANSNYIAVLEDGLSNNGSVAAFTSIIDFRYSFNIVSNNSVSGGKVGLTRYKPIYVVGTINSNDGLFYLSDTWWAQDEPTTEDGKIYIKVCESVYQDNANNPNGQYRGDSVYLGTPYYYKNGRFQEYVVAESANTDGNGNNIADTYLKKSDASNNYQPLDADLTAIAGLQGAIGVLKKTAANVWGLDTNIETYASNGNTAYNYFTNSVLKSANLPLATSDNRGGIKIGYSENGTNYAVKLSSEKAYVTVPWENTTYSTGAASELTTGTDTTGKLWGAKSIADYVTGKINTAISSALYFRGESTTAITNGGTEQATIGGAKWIATTGDLVLYDGKEFAWDGSKWIQLGDESSWAAKTVSITGTGYLSGGGTLESNRTIDISSSKITNNTSATAVTAGTNLITANTLYYHKGNSNIVTVGTITSGTWNGNAITAAYGGTGMSGENPFTGAYRIVYTSSATAMTTLAPNTVATKKFLSMTGTGSAGKAPVWSDIASTDLPAMYIGKTQVKFENTNEQALTGITTGSFSSNVTIGGTLTVSSTSTLNGNVTINSNKSLTLGNGVLTWDSNASAWKLTGNFYATGFVSAGGLSDGSGTGGIDETAMWEALAGEDSTKKINYSHLSISITNGSATSGQYVSAISYSKGTFTVTKTALPSYTSMTINHLSDTAPSTTGMLISPSVLKAYVTGLGYTTNTGTVIGSSLTANKIVLGNGTVNIKASTYGISTTAPSSSSDDTVVPTSKAVWSAISGASGYGKTGTVTSITISAGTGITVSATGAITTSGTRTISLDTTYLGNNYVTLATAQTITAKHKFDSGILLNTATSWTNSDRALYFAADGAQDNLRYYYIDDDKGLTYNPNTGALKAGSFVKRGGTFSQFLKADGSVDSNTYLTTSSAASTYVTIAGDQTVTGDKIFPAGIHLGNTSASLSEIGWYRIYSGDRMTTYGNSVILIIDKLYNSGGVESYVFSISVSYSGTVTFTELSGSFDPNNQFITKLRVDMKNNGYVYVDMYLDRAYSNGNTYRVAGFGRGVIQSPTAVTEVTGTAVEFDVAANGFKTSKNVYTDGSAVISGGAYFNNASLICFKDTSGTNRSVMTINASNELSIGYGSAANGINTNIYGVQVNIAAGTGRSTVGTFTTTGLSVTGTLTTTGKINGYTLAAACARGIDATLTATSTSTDLPTSMAVAALVSNYLPLAGGQMTGNLSWKNGTALPSTTSASYLLCIDAFADGGATKYINTSNITVGRATADGDGNTISSSYLKLTGGTLTGDLIIEKAGGATLTLRGNQLNNQTHTILFRGNANENNGFKIETTPAGSYGRQSLGFYTSNVSSGSAPYTPVWKRAFWIPYDNSSDNVTIGSSTDSYNLKVFGHVILPNNNGIRLLDTDGTVRNALYASTANNLIIGGGFQTIGNTYLYGASILLYAGSTNIATISSTGLSVTGAITASGLGTFETLKLTHNGGAVKHIEFSRASWNYLAAPTSGAIAFVTNGKAAGASNTDLLVNDQVVSPGSNNYSSLGSSTTRWSTVYGTNGDFAGALDVAGTLTVKYQNICSGTDYHTLRFVTTASDSYIQSKPTSGNNGNLRLTGYNTNQGEDLYLNFVRTYVTGNLIIPNGLSIAGKTADDSSSITLIGLSSGNNVVIGYGTAAGTDTNMYGTSVNIYTTTSRTKVATFSDGDLSVTGTINATSSGSFNQVIITNTSGSAARVGFSRAGANYLVVPSGGTLNFCTEASTVNINNSVAIFDADGIHPGTTNSKDLGTSSLRWSNIYGVNSNLSGTLTLSGSTKRIYFGSTYYIELNASNQLHTNAGFYSDSFVSAGGASDGEGMTLTSVSSNIIPDKARQYTLGSSTMMWSTVYTRYLDTSSGYDFRIRTVGTERMRIAAGGPYVSIGGVATNSSYSLYTAGGISCASLNNRSDIRLKNIIEDVYLSIDEIAAAPSVHFTWKSDGKDGVGSIAQYWKDVLPWAVIDSENEMAMDYGVISLVSAISIAKKVQDHEARIAMLEKENKELKEQLKLMSDGI